MSELEFVENMTPETLSGIIETKLKAHVGSSFDITQLRNTLFGMVKSQLLEELSEELSETMNILIYSLSNVLMSSSSSFGSVFGEYLFNTLPDFETKNLVKFHLMVSNKDPAPSFLRYL